MHITIDGTQHKISNSDLTVKDIFLLGDKPKEHLEEFELIRIIDGREDILYSLIQKPASSLADKVPLEDGEEFLIKVIADDTVTIKVNGDSKSWKNDKISYQEVIKLGFGDYKDHADTLYTMNYFNGPAESVEGALLKGQQVTVINGMDFSVTKTDKS